MLLVRGMEVEIDAAKRARLIVLTQDDGHVLIESNSVTELGTSAFVGLDGLVEQRDQSSLKFLGGFVQADDVLVIGLHRFGEFLAERFDCHRCESSNLLAKSEGKKVRKGGPCVEPQRPYLVPEGSARPRFSRMVIFCQIFREKPAVRSST